MSEDFEAPPMGGENIPFKEQEKDLPESSQVNEGVEGQGDVSGKKSKSKTFLIILLVAFLFLLFGLFLGLMFKGGKKPASSPSPSISLPSPSPLAVVPQQQVDLEKRITDFAQDLSQVDLDETLLNPPVVDYEIRYELKD